MNTTRTAGSRAAQSSAAAISAYIATVNAFFLSGRSIWIRRMPSARSVRIRLLMSLLGSVNAAPVQSSFSYLKDMPSLTR
jgi:hypothetical protein